MSSEDQRRQDRLFTDWLDRTELGDNPAAAATSSPFVSDDGLSTPRDKHTEEGQC